NYRQEAPDLDRSTNAVSRERMRKNPIEATITSQAPMQDLPSNLKRERLT
ncbi:18630_t:CDS:1, partial [Racocetra persica]